MPKLKEDYTKQEKINGVVYNMSPSANYRHSIVNGNIYGKLREGLKGSLCLAFMENLDYRYHVEKNDDYVIPDMVCIPSSRQLKKYKIFVLPGWISGNIFMPPIVAFHEIPLVLRLQALSVAGRLYSNLYIL